LNRPPPPSPEEADLIRSSARRWEPWPPPRTAPPHHPAPVPRQGRSTPAPLPPCPPRAGLGRRSDEGGLRETCPAPW